MWHNATIIAVLGMGWVFLFLALFALAMGLVSKWAAGEKGEGE